MAKNLKPGDLVAHRNRSDSLYIVLGFTYRVSRWGNRRIMKLFCSATGSLEYVLEEQLIAISLADDGRRQ